MVTEARGVLVASPKTAYVMRANFSAQKQGQIMSQDRLLKLMQANERVLLVGAPGCAKTARIAACAKQTGRKLLVMRVSLSERIDFGGCLIPDAAAGITRALPLELLRELQTTQVPTLFFADDLGQAPIDVQAALMKLFDEGELSENVLIWGATNRPGDKAGVTALCEPLRSRFALAFAIATPGVEDKPDGATVLQPWKDECDAWCDWALDQDADPAIVAWHRSTTGRTLYAWKPHADPAMRLPDFRSWHTVIRLFKAGIADLSTVGAAIGKGAAAEFLAFARLADKLPTPEQVWMDPDGAPVPAQSDPSSLYLAAGMLSAAVSDKTAGPFCRYIDRMPRVFAALAGRDAYRKLGAKLSGNKEWCKWWIKNQELFATASK